MEAQYILAGIDVHKKMLAVVVANAGDLELQFECRRFGTTVSELRHLSAWLQERAVREVVMESTAQYWRPVWLAQLETSLRSGQSGTPRGNREQQIDQTYGTQAPVLDPTNRPPYQANSECSRVVATAVPSRKAGYGRGIR